MKVAVLPSNAVRSVKSSLDFQRGNGQGAPIHFATIAPWEEAFFNTWPTDAHYIGYSVQGPDGKELEEWPRLSKTALGDIRENGHDVVTNMLSFDWDTPGHVPWTQSEISQTQFRKAFDRACENDEEIGAWTILYFSKSGARIVYFLDCPVPVEYGESLCGAMHERLRLAGIETDKLLDWTRLMRLPMVNRDGKLTQDQPYFSIDVQDRRLNIADVEVDTVNEQNDYSLFSSVELPEGAMPTEEEAREVMEVLKGRGWVRTQFNKDARRILARNAPIHDALFGSRKLFNLDGPGCNTTITETVGTLCVMLMNSLDYIEPLHIFALLHEKVSEIRPYKMRRSSEDWLMCLWDICCRMWAKEQSKVLKKEQEQEERMDRKEAAVKEAAADAMDDWFANPALGNGDAMEHLCRDGMDQLEALRSVAIAAHGSHYFIMKRNGKYSSKPVRKDGIISEIRMLGSEPLIPLSFVGEDGKARERSVKQIIDSHTVNVVEIKKRFMTDGQSGYVEGLLSQRPVLWFALDSRNPNVVPKHNDEVAEWIRRMDPSGRLAKWLSYAPAVDQGAICALFLISPPSTGKGMLVKGLAECFTNNDAAKADELVSGFQQTLARTCVIEIDEQLPKASGSYSADAAFRQIVTAGKITINEKFMPKYDVYNSPRILGTANNPHMVAQLFPTNLTEQDDRDAIMERMMYIDASATTAGQYLASLGGENHTGRDGARWIAGKNNQTSDYILASHIMWLYENREVKQGLPKGNSRLLVQGNKSNELSDGSDAYGTLGSIAMGNNEAHSAVCEAILTMFNIEDKRKVENTKSEAMIDREKLSLWVSVSGVREMIFSPLLSEKYPRKPNVQQISSALRCLRTHSSPKDAIVLDGREPRGKVLWYDIDLDQLESFAVELGGESAAFQEFASDSRILRSETRR